MSPLALALFVPPLHGHVVATAALPISINISKVVESFHPIAFSAAPTGSRILASMEDGTVRILDAKTHTTVRMLTKHPQAAYALAWSPSGQYVATGDETARIWIENAVNGAKIREYRTHKRGIQKLSFNAAGNLLISTGGDDLVNVYDLTSPKPTEMRSIPGNGANFYSATFNPLSTRFFTVAMLSGGLREYDAVTGKLNHTLADPNGQGTFDVTYSPTATRQISAGRDGDCVVWDATAYKRLGALRGHSDWVVTTAISPNGKLAATGSTDRTVKVWNLQSYTKIADFPDQATVGSPVCFSADGTSLMTVNVNGNMQFNTITPTQAATPVAETETPKSKRTHRRS